MQPSGTPYWQQPNAMVSVLNADDRAAIEVGATVGDDRGESGDYVCDASIPQAEDDDFPGFAFRQRRNLAGIKVEREKDRSSSIDLVKT
jgi:hypothetical protein